MNSTNIFVASDIPLAELARRVGEVLDVELTDKSEPDEACFAHDYAEGWVAVLQNDFDFGGGVNEKTFPICWPSASGSCEGPAVTVTCTIRLAAQFAQAGGRTR